MSAPAGPLAILLTAAPPAAGVDTAWRMARAAVSRGHGAVIFMMDDGVHAAAALAERVRILGEAGGGVRLIRCGQDARNRRAAAADPVTDGSQADWARAVAAAGRVITLN